MKHHFRNVTLMLLIAGFSFYLGSICTFSSKAQAQQNERKTDSQGKFFPVPPRNLPAQKASFGVTGKSAFRIDTVAEGSTAERLGMQKGDYLTEIDGKQFYSVADMIEMLAEKNPGEGIEVSFVRLNQSVCRREINNGKGIMLPLNKK